MNKYQYKVQGVDYDVEIEEVEGNVAKVNVNGIRFDVELKQPINPASTLKKVRVEAPKPVARPSVAPAAPVAAPTASAAPAGAGSAIKAPLPGTITDIKVNVGDTVKQGDVAARSHWIGHHSRQYPLPCRCRSGNRTIRGQLCTEHILSRCATRMVSATDLPRNWSHDRFYGIAG